MIPGLQDVHELYAIYNRKYYIIFHKVFARSELDNLISRSEDHTATPGKICATVLSHVSANTSVFEALRPFPDNHLQFIHLQAGTLSPTFLSFHIYCIYHSRHRITYRQPDSFLLIPLPPLLPSLLLSPTSSTGIVCAAISLLLYLLSHFLSHLLPT